MNKFLTNLGQTFTDEEKAIIKAKLESILGTDNVKMAWIPTVADNGLISWTLAAYSTQPPETMNIKGDKGDRGENGIDGEDGTSVTIQNIEAITGGRKVTFSDGNEITIYDGQDGAGVAIKGTVDDKSNLPSTAENGDAYIVMNDDGKLYVYANGWPDDGVAFTGPKGADGDTPTLSFEENADKTGLDVLVNGEVAATIPYATDGHSPVITTTATSTGNDIYIDGNKAFTVTDGIDGTNGKDGYTPSAKLATVTDAVHQNGGTSVTLSWPSEAAWLFPVSFTAWNGNDGTNGIDGVDGVDGENGVDGVDGVTPQITLTAYEPDLAHPYGGTKLTVSYPDSEYPTVTAVIDNGRDGDAGSLPTLPSEGLYSLSSNGEAGTWAPFEVPEGGAVSGENGLSARKDTDGTTYLGMNVETLDITGAGSVTVTSNPAGQLVISGKDATIPENIVTSSTDQATTGPWVLSAGQWVNGTSLMSMYKTSNVSNAKPVDSIVYNFHNSLADAQNNYNYIQITAGSNHYSMYTLVQPFKTSVTASNGISAKFTNDGVWQFGLDYTDITAADTQYAMTTTGWAEITGGTGDYVPMSGTTTANPISGTIIIENEYFSVRNTNESTEAQIRADNNAADGFAFNKAAWIKRHDLNNINGNMAAFGVTNSDNLTAWDNGAQTAMDPDHIVLDSTANMPIGIYQKNGHTDEGWAAWTPRLSFPMMVHSATTTTDATIEAWGEDNTLHFILE